MTIQVMIFTVAALLIATGCSNQKPPAESKPAKPSVLITDAEVQASSSIPNPTAGTGKPYIVGPVGTLGTGYFADQNNTPRLWVATETWCLPVRAGEWNGGNWQADYDNYFSARAAQGVTVCMTDATEGSDHAPYANGSTWDGLAPFVSGGDPTTGLNSPFWQRIDHMMNSARNNGITIGFTFNISYDNQSGHAFSGWTTAQARAYGAALGARYRNQPNLIWLFGNDAYQGTYDAQATAFLTGLRSAGANQPVIAWWSSEYTSRYETDNNAACTWGVNNSAANFCYTYNASYWVIEYAYAEAAHQPAATLLPVVLGDGYFYQGNNTYSDSIDRFARQFDWWVLASGARGTLSEAENVYQWSSAAALTNAQRNWYFANNLPATVKLFTSLPGWHLLMPDLGNTLVTAGRGTRVTGFHAGGSGGNYSGFSNSYVAASKTPDGSLAILYLPNPTTVTINQSLMAAGYTATWVDPVTCAKYTGTVGSAFNSGASDGTKPVSNSRGDPDWVLVLQAPSTQDAN